MVLYVYPILKKNDDSMIVHLRMVRIFGWGWGCDQFHQLKIAYNTQSQHIYCLYWVIDPANTNYGIVF